MRYEFRNKLPQCVECMQGDVVFADGTMVMAGDACGVLYAVAKAETESDGLQWQLVATCQVTCISIHLFCTSRTFKNVQVVQFNININFTVQL